MAFEGCETFLLMFFLLRIALFLANIPFCVHVPNNAE